MQRISVIITTFSLIALVAFVACSDSKTLNFGSFAIEVPNAWDPVKAIGIDSYVGMIAIDKQDTLFFDNTFETASFSVLRV